jgi:hypothetical protein
MIAAVFTETSVAAEAVEDLLAGGVVEGVVADNQEDAMDMQNQVENVINEGLVDILPNLIGHLEQVGVSQ